MKAFSYFNSYLSHCYQTPLLLPPGSEGLVNSPGVDCVTNLLYILL